LNLTGHRIQFYENGELRIEKYDSNHNMSLTMDKINGQYMNLRFCVKKYMRARAHIWILLGLSFLAAVSCGRREPVQDRLVVRLEEDPSTLDPARIVDYWGGVIGAKLYQGLLVYDEKLNLVGDLADSWSVHDGGKRYRFRLRESFFSNKEKVLSGDVKYSMERLASPETASPRSWMTDPILGVESFREGDSEQIDGIRVIGDRELEIELKEPLAIFPGLLAMPNFYVVPAGGCQGGGTVGSGPFMVASWKHDYELILERNPYWTGESPGVASIEYRIIPEDFSALSEYDAGSISVMEVPDSQLPTVRKRMPEQIVEIPGLNTYYIGMNCRRPPFDDARLRRALNMAVDREMIVRTLLSGSAVVAKGPIPPGIPGYDPGLKGYPYDPEAAAGLIEAVGWKGRIKLYGPADRKVLGRLVAIQHYLGEAGLGIDIVQLEWSAFKEAINTGEADLFYISWWADYPDGENFLFPTFHSSNRGPLGNRAEYSNPGVDRLIERARVTVDARKRAGLYRDAQRMIVEDAPWVFLWHKKDIWVHQPRVEGFRLYPVYNSDKGLGIFLNKKNSNIEK